MKNKLENIILFDTSIASTNKGDTIIMQAIKDNLHDYLRDKYVINFPTHTTCFSLFQSKFWWKSKYVKNADLKIVCGTNLLAKKMSYPFNNWNINLLNTGSLKDCILMGVGSSAVNKKPDLYTNMLFKKVLSKDYIHSTRDDDAKEYLESLGLRAITTGCPTLWKLTKDLCAKIPHSKASKVIISFSGDNRDYENDQYLIDVCKKHYEKIFVWVQTVHDMAYLNELKGLEEAEFIYADLEKYDEILCQQDIDYIGTRLHGGIFAMQRRKRAIIIAIDNRATNMNKVNNLNCIQRKDVKQKLEEKILSEFETDVKINIDNIEIWKSQFNKYK